MRKVLFKRWIPRELTKAEGQRYETTKLGTACWSGFDYQGLFHEWGVGCSEGETSFGNYSIALIELPDGTIEEVLPTNIKFVS
jgi:hypothetical protein